MFQCLAGYAIIWCAHTATIYGIIVFFGRYFFIGRIFGIETGVRCAAIKIEFLGDQQECSAGIHCFRRRMLSLVPHFVAMVCASIFMKCFDLASALALALCELLLVTPEL